MQVLAQENVGPYATVQLHSTDSGALDAWLTTNGFDIPAAVQPILDAYVMGGFDFLAMKLLPNQGVQAMRPVRVTMPGASLSLPLRMASVGTGAVTGITIWVVADGRYEPQNFAFFHIDDSQLVWDWSTNPSNYTTLRVQEEATLKNAGWEIESSIALNEQLITNTITSGGQYFGSGAASNAPVDASQDYLPVGSADAGAERRRRGLRERRAGARRRHQHALRRADRTHRPGHAHPERHRAERDDLGLRLASRPPTSPSCRTCARSRRA